jgi:hypothetical protein
MNANSNTSFFDEPVEDESITLNEDELNNILEEGAAVSEEPDVIVIEKEKIAPSLDLSGTDDASLSLEGADSDELSAARELMDSPAPAGSEEMIYVEPGFEDVNGDLNSSGITDATEISEITAFDDAAPAPAAEPRTETAGLSEPVAAPVTSVPSAESEMPIVDEEISLSGEELENIVASGAVEIQAAALETESLAAETAEPETAEAEPAEGVVFSDETALAADLPHEIEETSSLGDIPENTSAEEIEFERLEDEELPAPAVETLSEVEPIELESLDAESVTVLDEEPASASGTEETVLMVDEPDAPADLPGITPLAFEEPASAAPAVPETFDGIEEIDLEEPPSASAAAVTIQKQAAAKTDNLKLYPDEPAAAAGSFFSDSDEDEAITLSSDELNNILDNADVDEGTGTAAPLAGGAAAAVAGALSRDNLKEIFVYLDNLLDKLPEGEIKRFAESRYYDLYNQIFDELDII